VGTVEEQIAALAAMSSKELKEEWWRLTGTPLPRISPAMLRLALAWEIQARAFGGLSRETTRKLDQLAAAKTRTSPVTPGMRLVREWDGKVHVVTIGDDNVIRWNDRPYGSLSEVARAITGTRWSGPAFFGLKKRVAA
jgi:hypothetical protein